MDENFQLNISAGVVENITSSLPSIQLPLDAFGYFNSLPLADCNFNEVGSIQLLLGVNVHTKIMLSEIKRFGRDLIAEKSLLGYLIRGRVSNEVDRRSSVVFMTKSATVDLNSQIKKFWEIEEVVSKSPIHPNDALCENIFINSIYK